MKNKIVSVIAIMVMGAMFVTGCGNEKVIETSNNQTGTPIEKTEVESSVVNESVAEDTKVSEEATVENKDAVTAATELTDEDFEITVNNTVIKIGGDMAANRETMGEPTDYSAAKSCMADGDDKIFTYGDINIYTHPVDGMDKIYLIEINDGAVLKSGVTIGSTLEEVEGYYGSSSEMSGTEHFYSFNGKLLGIDISDSGVTFIEITEE